MDVQNRVAWPNANCLRRCCSRGSTSTTVARHSDGHQFDLADRAYDDLYLSNLRPDQRERQDCARQGSRSGTCTGKGDYGMRIWVDPDKLAQAGHHGWTEWPTRSRSRICRRRPGRSAPAGPPGQQFQFAQVKGRLTKPRSSRHRPALQSGRLRGTYERYRLGGIGRQKLRSDLARSMAVLGPVAGLPITRRQCHPSGQTRSRTT